MAICSMASLFGLNSPVISLSSMARTGIDMNDGNMFNQLDRCEFTSHFAMFDGPHCIGVNDANLSNGQPDRCGFASNCDSFDVQRCINVNVGNMLRISLINVDSPVISICSMARTASM